MHISWRVAISILAVLVGGVVVVTWVAKMAGSSQPMHAPTLAKIHPGSLATASPTFADEYPFDGSNVCASSLATVHLSVGGSYASESGDTMIIVTEQRAGDGVHQASVTVSMKTGRSTGIPGLIIHTGNPADVVKDYRGGKPYVVHLNGDMASSIQLPTAQYADGSQAITGVSFCVSGLR